MEYISGQDLKGLIRQTGQLTVGKSISIAKQICDGLSEAHNLGVVHRDLKPHNIMIDQGGSARIMDFGIARAVKGKSITGSGVVIGTPQYMSPEQVEGKDIDQRSDIYSLGIILYEMLTDRVPFEGDTPLSVGVKQKTEAPKDPKTFNERIPDDLNQLILKCLKKESEKRYQDADELRSDLEKLEQGLPTTDRVVPKKKTLTSKEITVKFNVKRALIPTVIVLVIAIAALFIWRFILPSNSSIDSLAVLPFDDLSPGRDQGHLAQGIPSTLISALSRLEGLRVRGKTSSFSFKGDMDIKEIGQRLSVETVLEGDIQTSGDNLRITVRLVKAKDGFQIWSDIYQHRTMDDVFIIQDDIAQSVVNELKVKFQSDKGEKLVKTSTENSEALNLYFQGRVFYSRGSEKDLYQAIELFQKALQADQSFALAYLGQAQSFLILSNKAVRSDSDILIQAETAVKEALKLDNSLAEAHSAYGTILATYRWDWEKAEQEHKLALQLNPGSSSVLLDYYNHLQIIGRNKEAFAQIKRALEIDPLSAQIMYSFGMAQASLGRYDEAVEHFLDALEIYPKIASFFFRLARVYIEMGEFEKGIQTLSEQIKLMEGENISDEIGLLAYAYAKWGKRKEAAEYLKQLITYSEEQYVSPTIFAMVYGALGDLNEAFERLDQAYGQHDARIVRIQTDFIFDSIRNDSRYTEMLKNLGLDK
jgi:serine/threonine protein kinase/tetratricopeptide (TPR) repeat protein